MIYITQLIYLKPGQEDIFNQFEKIAIPLIAKYNGKVQMRLQPHKSDIIESNIEVPYEIHLITFKSDSDFEQFMQDEERKKYLHLKEQSIRSVLLLKGNKI